METRKERTADGGIAEKCSRDGLDSSGRDKGRSSRGREDRT
jgi:hypothetical protein